MSPDPAENPETVAVFVDTNCFLHARDLKDLPWRELFPACQQVEIMVTPTVTGELDVKKVGGTRRVRDRTLAAIANIDTASENDQMRTVLRAKDPLVALGLANPGRIDWNAFPDFDPTRGDDRLVAETMATQCTYRKVLLSHDRGPLIRARFAKLDARRLPPSWLLPQEEDDATKRIRALQRENETLKANRPQLGATWLHDGKPIETLRIDRLVVAPLTGPAIIELVERCVIAMPQARATLNIGSGWRIGDDDDDGKSTQDDHESYAHDYRNFKTALPRFFADLHDKVAAASSIGQVQYQITNRGSTMAEGLTADICITGGWRLRGDEQRAGVPTIAAPEPPPTPHLRRNQPITATGSYPIAWAVQRMPGQDPTQFYWAHPREHDIRHAVLRCEEFRAKAEFQYKANFEPTELTDTGSIHIELHSRNSSDPVRSMLALEFANRPAEWNDPKLLSLVPQWIAEVLRAQFPER